MAQTRLKEPLAYRMCPRSIEDFVGQSHILSKGTMLYRMIETDMLSSVIFYGPPGTGKTSIAKVIANATKSNFSKLNAVNSGIADIKQIVNETQNPLLNPSGRTVLFIDEIHRFNKAQQDALLPYVENGTIILIGATTENPFFEVNKALISRSTVFMLNPLTNEDVEEILRRALADEERGYGRLQIELDEDALHFLAEASSGDARSALNGLELAVLSTNADENGVLKIDVKTITECIQKKAVRFDKSGDGHYDNISAFIKSMRGSDPDAAVFYLARALYAGEDPMFLARRIMICAAEDVGMANPSALNIAVSAAQAVHMMGMPEARIPLAEAAIYVATSPKSNAAYTAINKALNDVETKNTGEVPMHLRNAEIKGMEKLGYGVGYKYAHSYEGNWVAQQFLPDPMVGTIYYEPTDNGYEGKMKEFIHKRRGST